MEGQRRSQVLPLFAEGIREAGKALAPLPQTAVLPLDMGRADALHVWVSVDGLRFGADDLRRAVATLAFLRLSVDLDELRVIDAVAQVSTDGDTDKP